MNMKKLALLVLLSASGFNATAADSVDLVIKGELSNSACVPGFSNGGVVDYGGISTSSMAATTTNQVGVKDITFTITCAVDVAVGMNTLDNRKSSMVSTVSISSGDAAGAAVTTATNMYGLGMAGTVAMGAMSIYVDVPNAKLDGTAADVISTQTLTAAMNSTWAKSTTGLTSPNVSTLSLAGTGTTTPKAGKVHTFPLKVSAAVVGKDTLGITDAANFDGSATFTLVYL